MRGKNDVEEAEQARERLVRPEVRGEYEGVTCRSRIQDPLDAEARRSRTGRELSERRWIEPVHPLGTIVDLEVDGKPGRPQRLEMMVDRSVELGVAGRNEACGKQIRLGPLRVRDDQVEIDERP